MANTASTTTAISNAATANFRTWVAEIIAQLIAVGLTQTADTGQINTGTVNKSGSTSTAVGYAIFRFNDTLQSSSPIYLRLDFGNGSALSNPAVWLTVGTSTNGAGVLGGVVVTQCACFVDQAPNSTSTTYLSRFVYNPTYGFLAMAWKIGSNANGVYSAMGGFIIGRSNDATGAATADAAFVITNSSTTSGNASGGYLQCISFLNSALYPMSSGTPAWASDWQYLPFYQELSTTSLIGTNIQVGMTFYTTPNIELSDHMAIAYLADIPVSTTVSMTLVGSTSKTYIGVGYIFGSYAFANLGNVILWQ
jgi:hypothetical protein